MGNTQTLPTDRNGDVYYGPKTYSEAVSQINFEDEQSDSPSAKKEAASRVAAQMQRAGYLNVAARIRREYC